MKVIETAGRAIVAYTDKDLKGFEEHFQTAREVWRTLSENARKKDPKGHGSIIMGDGIAVWHLPPKCRKPQSKIVVSPRGQGCGYYEPYKDFILGYLDRQGIKAHYDYGRMD